MTARPADFSVQYQNYTAPLPPPHYSEHTIWIGPGPEGVVQMGTGDPAAAWTERFPLFDSHLDWLYQVMTDQGVLQGEWRSRTDVPVGSGAERATVVADGKSIAIPAFVTPDRDAAARAVFGAIRALVPQGTWDSLAARRAQHAAQFNRGPQAGAVPGTFAPTGEALFDAPSVAIAAFLGSPVAGGTIMAINFSRTGQSQQALIAVAGTLALTVAMVLLQTPKVISLAVSLGVAFALSTVAERLQGPAIAAHRQRGGRIVSRWAAAGIGVVFFALLFGAIYLAIQQGILPGAE